MEHVVGIGSVIKGNRFVKGVDRIVIVAISNLRYVQYVQNDVSGR